MVEDSLQDAGPAALAARPRFAWNLDEVSGALGDLGTFLLPLGVGFIYAARNPVRNAVLLGVAA